jgi:hypothetical protein
MELKVIRKEFSSKTSIGELYINDVFFCYTLEDTDRNLMQTMGKKEIEELKIYGKTAIPYGRYEVIMSWSNKFKCIMPLVNGVVGYTGIRIHKGNSEVDTLGCLLVGMKKGIDKITNSTDAFDRLFILLKDACAKGKVWITYEKAIENCVYR